MIRNRFHKFIPLLATLLLMFAGGGCVDPMTPEERVQKGGVQLTLQIFGPSGALTKATPVNASDDENKLYDLRVWAFIHGDGAGDGAVAYAHKENAIGITDGSVTLSFTNSANGLLDRNDPVSIDIYVLGNAASVGFTGDETAARSTVRDAVISGDEATGFGKACVETVGTNGLPMSCYLEDFDITFLRYGYTPDQLKGKTSEGFVNDGDTFTDDTFTDKLSAVIGLSDLQKSYLRTLFRNDGNDSATHPYKWNYNRFAPSLMLTRAVGKIRFVFAKDNTVNENVVITHVDFIGREKGVVPTQSYLFPLQDEIEGVSNRRVKPEGTEYEVISWPGDNAAVLVGSVHGIANLPEEYESSLETSEADKKTIYLRESDIPLRGRILYKRGETELQSTFDLVTLAEYFPRNATFTVYAYFVGGTLSIQLSVEVDPWDKNNHRVTFEEGSIYAERKFIIDQSTAQAVVPIRVDPNDPNSKIARYDVYLKPNSPVKGSLKILTPKEGTLIIIKKEDPIGSFVVTPQMAEINVEKDGGHIEISIDRSASGGQGASMTLSFGVEWPGREANADSELIDDKYRFVL